MDEWTGFVCQDYWEKEGQNSLVKIGKIIDRANETSAKSWGVTEQNQKD